MSQEGVTSVVSVTTGGDTSVLSVGRLDIIRV